MSTYVRWPSTTGTIPTYADYASLPATANNGAVAETLDTYSQYIYDLNTTTWKLQATALNTVTTVGTYDSLAGVAAGAQISSNSIFFQSATATVPGMLSTGTQTIAGAKTFTGAISASNLSGTNTGDVTLAAVGSSPSANGASLSGQVLTLQPADGTTPGLLTATTQTIGGAKTFSSTLTVANLIDSGLTASTVPYADSSKQLTSSAVTPTELGYVHGVTSAIQTQLDSKQAAITIGALDASSGATGLTLSAGTLSTQSASASQPGLVNTTTQTMAGAKTFSTSVLSPIFSTSAASPAASGTIRLANSQFIRWRNALDNSQLGIELNNSNVFVFESDISVTGTGAFTSTISASNFSGTSSGTNTGDVTLANLGGTPNDAGLSLTGQQIQLQPADATHPGALSTGSQTIGGAKTFGSAPIFSALTASTVPYLDASKVLTSSAVTPTELGYVAGVTSSIQTQLNAKMSNALTSAHLFVGNGSNVATDTAVTGDITITNGGVTAIGTNKVANSQLAQMTSLTVKGNSTGSTANASDLTLASAATASSVTYRDSNANSFFNGVGVTISSVATAGGTTTIAASDHQVFQFTGSSTQTVVLPDATTLTLGYSYRIINKSTGTVTVQDASTGTLQAMIGNTSARFTVRLAGSAAGTWVVEYWPITTVPISLGGTGQTTASAAFNALSPITTKGDLIGGTGTNTTGRLGVGTNTYVLVADSSQTTGMNWVNLGASSSSGTTATSAWPVAAGAYTDLTNLTLAAGTWVLSGMLATDFSGGAGTTAFIILGITTTSGNSGTGILYGQNASLFTPVLTSASNSFTTVAGYIVTPGTSTTYYLKAYGDTSVTNLRTRGYSLNAVRIA